MDIRCFLSHWFAPTKTKSLPKLSQRHHVRLEELILLTFQTFSFLFNIYTIMVTGEMFTLWK